MGTAIPVPETKIIFTKAPYFQYEQILLDKNTKDGNPKNTTTKNIRNKCRTGFFRY